MRFLRTPSAFVFFTLLLGLTHPAQAAETLSLSTQADTLLLVGIIPFIPAMLLLMTSFTRILIVLSLIRHALGLQTTPPTQILVGLALVLSATVMEPTISQINTVAWTPWRNNEISAMDAAAKASQPLRSFMQRQVRAETVEVFYPSEKAPTLDQVPFMKLTGSFVLSELKTGFEIGLLIFVPFLIIDLIVASILMSLGMMMLSPVMVSLPIKILIFVLADGWALIAGGLIGSFS